MRLATSLRRTTVAASLGFAAACSDTTSPPAGSVSFDAAHALAIVDPMAAVFEEPVFKSFDAAGSYFEAFFRSDLTTPASLASVGGAFLPQLTRPLSPAATMAAGAIPDDAKGKTFVYDIAAHTYVAYPAATGAPAMGVRFVLYTWQSGTGQPASPLVRIGYVDIAPLDPNIGSPQPTMIQIVRDTPRLIVAAFAVSHSTGAGVHTFGIHGSATNGTAFVDIALDGTEAGDAGRHHLVYNTRLASEFDDVSVSEQLTYDQATVSQTGKLELAYEGHTLTDESVATGARVRFDGQLYANVVFPPAGPGEVQYLKPDGTPLAQQEIIGLNALLERVAVATFVWISLAFP